MHYQDDGPRVGLTAGLLAGMLSGILLALISRGRSDQSEVPFGVARKRRRTPRGWPALEESRRDLAAALHPD